MQHDNVVCHDSPFLMITINSDTKSEYKQGFKDSIEATGQ